MREKKGLKPSAGMKRHHGKPNAVNRAAEDKRKIKISSADTMPLPRKGQRSVPAKNATDKNAVRKTAPPKNGAFQSAARNAALKSAARKAALQRAAGNRSAENKFAGKKDRVLYHKSQQRQNTRKLKHSDAKFASANPASSRLDKKEFDASACAGISSDNNKAAVIGLFVILLAVLSTVIFIAVSNGKNKRTAAEAANNAEALKAPKLEVEIEPETDGDFENKVKEALPDTETESKVLKANEAVFNDATGNHDIGYLHDDLIKQLKAECSENVSNKVAAFQEPRSLKQYADKYKIRIFFKEQYLGVFIDSDKSGDFKEMIMAFAVSTADTANGYKTPGGSRQLGDKLTLGYMIDGSYGRYCTYIAENVMLHSMPSYHGTSNAGISAIDWNNLGSEASHGCVRMTYRDALWIYDMLPKGTPIDLLPDRGKLTGLPEKMPVLKMPENGPTWDPTDPDPLNPYVSDPSILYKVN